MYILGYIYRISNQAVRKSTAPARRHGRVAGAGQGARRALAALRRWRERRAAILEIQALPDRLLRDIGLERPDIDAKVTALMGQREAQAMAAPGRAGVPAGPVKIAACG